MRVVHERKYDFDCMKCGKKFSTNYLMQTHSTVCKKLRQGVNISEDPIIEDSLEDSPSLIHGANVAPVENKRDDLGCGTCGESFPQKVYLKRHVEANHDGKYECEVCGNHYSSLVIKIHHVKVAHEHKKDFECLKCGKKFGWQWSLQQHSRGCQGIEDGPNPDLQKFIQAVMNILKAKGIEQQNVLNHDITEGKAEIKKYIAPPAKSNMVFKCGTCGKRFTQRGNLRTHIVTIHQKRKDFQCKICGDKFGRIFVLQRHMKNVHHQNADYKCELCSKTLFSNQKLKLHMRICHNVKMATPKNKLRRRPVEVLNLISPGKPGSWPTGIKIEANADRQGEKIHNRLNQNHQVVLSL